MRYAERVLGSRGVSGADRCRDLMVAASLIRTDETALLLSSKVLGPLSIRRRKKTHSASESRSRCLIVNDRIEAVSVARILGQLLVGGEA
jgi:hypothetical protein